MSASLIVILYSAFFLAGSRNLRAKGLYREVSYFLVLLGCCTYLSLGKLYGWASVQHGFPFSGIFLSLGKELQEWIGGPPHE